MVCKQDDRAMHVAGRSRSCELLPSEEHQPHAPPSYRQRQVREIVRVFAPAGDADDEPAAVYLLT